MLAEIKLEAVEWFYMEIDYALKQGKTISHGEVFEKTLDTAMRDLSDFEYMVWCFEIASRYERQMLTMAHKHIMEIEKAVQIYENIDISQYGLTSEEQIRLASDHKITVDYIKWAKVNSD